MSDRVDDPPCRAGDELTATNPAAGLDSRTWPAAGAIALLSAIIAGAWSWVPSTWSDEAATVTAAARPLRQLPALVNHIDLVNAAYYVAMHAWFAVVGIHTWSLRLPSVVGVAVAVLGTVVLGTRVSSPRVGVLAGLLVGLIPQTLWAATEARVYAWTITLAVWSALVLVVAMGERSSRWWWALFGALTAVSIVVFLFLALLFAAFAVSVAVLPQWRPHWRRFAVAVLGAVVVTAPFTWEAVRQRGQVGWIPKFSLTDLRNVVGGQWFGGRVAFSHSNSIKLALTLAVWALVIMAVVTTVRRRGGRGTGTAPQTLVALALPWLVLPPAVLVAVSLVAPAYTARYVTYCVPSIALLAASTLERLRVGWRVVAILVVAALVLPIYAAQRGSAAKFTDWSSVASRLESSSQPGDAFYVIDRGVDSAQQRVGVRSILQVYPDATRRLDDIALGRSAADVGDFSDQVVSADQLAGRLTGHDRLWLVVAPAGLAWVGTPEGQVLTGLGFTQNAQYRGVYDDVVLLTRAGATDASDG